MNTVYINSPEIQDLNKREILQSQKTEDGMSVVFLYDSNFKSTKILRDYVEAICDTI
jgi:hypothetical protein